MTQLDQVTQSSSSSSERGAQAAGVMLSQSKQLQKCARSLQILMLGSQAQASNNFAEGIYSEIDDPQPQDLRTETSDSKRKLTKKRTKTESRFQNRFDDPDQKEDEEVVGFHGVPSQNDIRFKDAG